MKKLISSISGIAAGVFAFLGFLMPALVFTTELGSLKDSEKTSGFDFISFETASDFATETMKNLNTLNIVFSVIAILFFVVAGVFALVSIANLFVKDKKNVLAKVQKIVAIVFAVLAVLLFVFAMSYTITFNNDDLLTIAGTINASVGIGIILVSVVSVIASVLVVLFGAKAKKK